jgi:hypothetical protein
MGCPCQQNRIPAAVPVPQPQPGQPIPYDPNTGMVLQTPLTPQPPSPYLTPITP